MTLEAILFKPPRQVEQFLTASGDQKGVGIVLWNGDSGRVLIVGASGQVGAAMCRYLHRTGRGGTVLPAARTPNDGWITLDLATLVDVANARAVLAAEDLSAIVCTAGWTHVDGCEGDPERSHQANATGPAMLAGYAWERRIPFVYYSTDYIFNGFDATPGPYREDDPTDPLSVYGRHKLLGEAQVTGYHPDALILRTSWVFGEDAQQKNFVYQVLKRLTLGEQVRVPQDQVSTPAYIEDLAQATFALMESGERGVFHACGPDVVNRRQFAGQIAQAFGFETGSIQGVRTVTLNQPAPRPLAAGLDSSRLASFLSSTHPNVRMRSIDDALNDCRGPLKESIARWRTQQQAEPPATA